MESAGMTACITYRWSIAGVGPRPDEVVGRVVIRVRDSAENGENPGED